MGTAPRWTAWSADPVINPPLFTPKFGDLGTNTAQGGGLKSGHHCWPSPHQSFTKLKNCSLCQPHSRFLLFSCGAAAEIADERNPVDPAAAGPVCTGVNLVLQRLSLFPAGFFSASLTPAFPCGFAARCWSLGARDHPSPEWFYPCWGGRQLGMLQFPVLGEFLGGSVGFRLCGSSSGILWDPAPWEFCGSQLSLRSSVDPSSV